MAIELHLSLVVDGRPEHRSLEKEYITGETVAAFFKRMDREKIQGRKFFKKLFASKRFLTLLVNGTRLEIPGGMDAQLTDGDQISLLVPMIGG